MDRNSGERLDKALYDSLEGPGESNVQFTHTMNTRYPSASSTTHEPQLILSITKAYRDGKF